MQHSDGNAVAAPIAVQTCPLGPPSAEDAALPRLLGKNPTSKAEHKAEQDLEQGARKPPAGAGTAPATANTERAPRLAALDAPRWIASVLIVTSHFYTDIFREWHPSLGIVAQWGSMWTQFFFILSAFVLSYVEMVRPAHKARQQPGMWMYVKRRLITVYPTYALASAFTMLQSPVSLGGWITLPLNVSLLQAWAPVCWHAELTWLGPYECSFEQWTKTGWFMSVLLSYWLLVRPLAHRMKVASLRTTLLWLALAWLWSGVVASCAAFLPLLVLQPSRRFLLPVLLQICQFGPAGYVHVFVAGVGLARLFIIVAVRDSETGGPTTAETTRFVLCCSVPEEKDGLAPPSKGMLAASFVCRYGCCLGYAVYGAAVLAHSLLARPGGVAEWLSFDSNSRIFYFTMHNGGLLPIFALIVLGAACGEDPLAKRLFMTRLGIALSKTSYAQYLIQFNVLLACQLQFGRYALVALPIALPLAAYAVEKVCSLLVADWQRSA